MWTSTIDLDIKRVAASRLLGLVWPGAYFTSFAPLQVQNVVRASLPETSWVRVRNRLAGICGSDLHFVYGDGDFRIAPAALPRHRIYPGHELLGEVIEVGEDAQHLRVGDRVALQYAPNCISAGLQPPCSSCASANFALCERGAFPQPQEIGGGWSEEMLLHESRLYRVSSALSDEQAMMIEPTAVALHAVLRSLPKAGDQVLIVGAGTIGLLTLQIVHALAPQAEISVLARHPFQVEQATRMGARHIIYQQDSYTGVQRATQARLYRGPWGNKMLLGGYDVVFDTVGKRKTLHHALRWAKARGTVVLVGVDFHFMHIDLSPIWYREVNLIGTLGHGIEYPDGEQPRSTFSLAEEMIQQGKICPEQLITHRFAINHYREALQAASSKEQSRSLKVVFDYSLVPATVVPNVRASARKPNTSTRPPLLFDDIAWEEDDYQPPQRQETPVTPLPVEEAAMTMPPTGPLDVEVPAQEQTLRISGKKREAQQTRRSRLDEVSRESFMETGSIIDEGDDDERSATEPVLPIVVEEEKRLWKAAREKAEVENAPEEIEMGGKEVEEEIGEEEDEVEEWQTGIGQEEDQVGATNVYSSTLHKEEGRDVAKGSLGHSRGNPRSARKRKKG